MRVEYYFSETADLNSWKDFLIKEQNGTMDCFYKKITGYDWKDKFGFNPNGESLYINENGDGYEGVWFETDTRKIAIFNVFSNQIKTDFKGI